MSRKAPAASIVRPGAVASWHTLGAVLSHLGDSGVRVPCVIDPEPFTSEAPVERREAARACQGCPAQVSCLAFAQANREPFHVWGGVDRAPRSRPASIDERQEKSA